MTGDAPRRGRGRPRKDAPAGPLPVRVRHPLRDPRRFAAAWAAHLERTARLSPRSASVAAALLFENRFRLYAAPVTTPPRAVTVGGRDAMRVLPGRTLNVYADMRPLPGAVAIDKKGGDWRASRVASEARMIRRTLDRLRADPDGAEWLEASAIALAMLVAPPMPVHGIIARDALTLLGWESALRHISTVVSAA